MKRLVIFVLVVLLIGTFSLFAEGQKEGGAAEEDMITIGLSMETLESQFWSANYDAMVEYVDTLPNVEMITVIADGDAARQNQQIETLISRGVDAIICAPKDNKAIVAAIKKANGEGIPFITNNRAAAEGAEVALDVSSDSFMMAQRLGEACVEYAKSTGEKQKALVFIGDLKDINAVFRDKGFMQIANSNRDWIEVVNHVPTEWKPELAQAGTVNSLQADPDIGIIFTPSDFLLPAIVAGLQQTGNWHPYDHPDHIYIATLDGAKDALFWIDEGFVDIVSVQQAYETGRKCVDGAIKLANGEELLDSTLQLPGFEVTRENYEEMAPKAWGFEE